MAIVPENGWRTIDRAGHICRGSPGKSASKHMAAAMRLISVTSNRSPVVTGPHNGGGLLDTSARHTPKGQRRSSSG